MGWEKRGNKSYYYRKVRHGNRVRSVYVGSDVHAELQAKLIEDCRGARRDEREALRRIQQVDKEIDRQIDDVERALTFLTDASFSAAGYRGIQGLLNR